MGFREIRPQRNNSVSNRENTVRVSFSKVSATGKYNLNVYIGGNVAKDYGLKDRDKISFNVDEDNPRIWLLKKATNGVGYTLMDSENKSGTVLRLQMGWNEYKPEDREKSVREVKHGMYEGSLRIFGTL